MTNQNEKPKSEKKVSKKKKAKKKVGQRKFKTPKLYFEAKQYQELLKDVSFNHIALSCRKEGKSTFLYVFEYDDDTSVAKVTKKVNLGKDGALAYGRFEELNERVTFRLPLDRRQKNLLGEEIVERIYG